ncbi:MAG: MFS transporter [Gammaproteobacteria bacterium]|nr:MFS transporter [Gammaproteobacteria bacterium]
MRQLGAVAAAYSLATTPFNIAPLLVGAVITVLGASEQQSGQLMTLELLSMSVVAMVAAPLGQQACKPWVLTLAVLLLVVVHSISALVGSYTLLLPLRIVAGIGAGTLLLAVNTTIATSSDPVRLYGACSMATATVGLLLLLITPSLIAGLGMAGAYAPLALVALIVLGIVRWMGSPDSADVDKQAPVVPEGSAISPMVIGVLLIALFAIQFTQGALYSFSERIGVEQAALSSADMGILLAVGYAAAIPASAFATWLSYRLGRYLPLIAGMLVYALATVGMAVASDPQAYAVNFVLFNFGYFFLLPYQLGIPADLDHSGKLSGLGVGIFFIGMSCGAFLGGVLVTHFGYSSLGFVAATGGGVGLLMLLFVVRRGSQGGRTAESVARGRVGTGTTH